MHGEPPKIECATEKPNPEPEKRVCHRIQVANAGYAGCNGIYNLNSQRVTWSKEKPTYLKESGNRWVYWNRHGYGWSVGPSFGGMFYYGGSTANGAEPYMGTWNRGVKVTCLDWAEQCKRVLLSGAPYGGNNGYYALTDKTVS